MAKDWLDRVNNHTESLNLQPEGRKTADDIGDRIILEDLLCFLDEKKRGDEFAKYFIERNPVRK